jgi:prepilin-type N-terminal cleavage/methylation domain-containing protein
MKINSTRKGGFTLVEIMIVVAIIGLLAAIAIPNFVTARQRAQVNTCIANMKQIEGAIETYMLETRTADMPGSVGALVTANYIRSEPYCPAGAVGSSYPIPAAGARVVCPNVDATKHNAVLP